VGKARGAVEKPPVTATRMFYSDHITLEFIITADWYNVVGIQNTKIHQSLIRPCPVAHRFTARAIRANTKTLDRDAANSRTYTP
jgi:hypothetical protein